MLPDEVLIVGAGPAGCIAGLVLARAGVRVRLVDRAAFPRDKLCGDTLNPGTLARLRALRVTDEIESRGLRVEGMLVTSARDAVVGRYPSGLFGRAIVRRDLDAILLAHAVAAGCAFEPRVRVTGPLLDGGAVVGAAVGRAGRLTARVTIAADGRRSAIAWALGAARHPVRPRRWAIGAYFEEVRPWSDHIRSDHMWSDHGQAVFGEMHVRSNCYIGVAPVGQNLTNVCLVRPAAPADAAMREPVRLLADSLTADPQLAPRFAGARLATPPVVLGPLAVDATPPPIDGLLFAGDAAGFVDPMTGDGLRFAVEGGELAAAAALDALTQGWSGVHARLASRRREAFAPKQRFNRGLRALVASPALVDAAAVGARFMAPVLQHVIAHAGDCHMARAAVER